MFLHKRSSGWGAEQSLWQNFTTNLVEESEETEGTEDWSKKSYEVNREAMDKSNDTALK